MGRLTDGFSYCLVQFSWILLVFGEFGNSYYIASGSCGVAPLKNAAVGRIVNGSISAAGSWPWQVLVMENGAQSCGGSLISEEWIMTAAHCIVGDITAHTFYVGAHYIDVSGSNAQEVKAHLHICHSDYNDRTFENDICVIKLTERVNFNDYIVPVCLPQSGTIIADGERVTVTGWGDTEGTGSNNELREAEVVVLNRADCSGWYGNDDIIIPEDHFCAGYQQGQTDTCRGDSGGPLVHEETESGITAYVLRGMTSFGVGCAVAQRPGVYVTVAEYISWIDQKMAQVSGDSCQPVQSSECGRVLFQSGTIRSPAILPNYAYPSNTRCSWSIIAPAGSWIRFNFTCYFLLSPEGKDCDDSVSIVSTAGTKEFCGNQLPDPYLVETSSATLTFSSNSNLEYPGFVVEVEFIEQTTQAVTVTTQATSTHTTLTTTTSSVQRQRSNEIILCISLYFLLSLFL